MSLSPIRWSELVYHFLREHGTLYLKRTSMNEYHGILEAFGAHYNDPTVRSVTMQHIEGWMRDRMVEINKPTVNKHLRHLKAFLYWATRHGWIEKNPAVGIRMLKIPKVDRRWKALQIAQVTNVIRWYEEQSDHEFADQIRAALNFGPRLGELLHLQVMDVDLERRVLYIRNKGQHELKDLADRALPLNDEGNVQILQRRILAVGRNPEAYLFPSDAGTARDNANELKKLKKAGKALAIPQLTWQNLRHTFGTVMSQHVMPAVLMAWMGHEDIRTSMTYYYDRTAISTPLPSILGSLQSADVQAGRAMPAILPAAEAK